MSAFVSPVSALSSKTQCHSCVEIKLPQWNEQINVLLCARLAEAVSSGVHMYAHLCHQTRGGQLPLTHITVLCQQRYVLSKSPQFQVHGFATTTSDL